MYRPKMAEEAAAAEPRRSSANASTSSSLTGLFDRITAELQVFYQANPQIKESHGIQHVLAVHQHSVRALACIEPSLPDHAAAEIEIAALLHDVDDHKYFDNRNDDRYPNATEICRAANVPSDVIRIERILKMISWVGCSENGNSVPDEVASNEAYHLLIPRWADRLEAVGAVGVVRCYKYNQEKGAPLFSAASPRPQCSDEVWRLATPDRFDAYLSSGGKSTDMISHYYDKLLHVARPPPSIVRNRYLENMAVEGARELVEVCLRFGRTGVVHEEYILSLAHCGAMNSQLPLLDDLPHEVLTKLLTTYCDTSSLSSLLTALSSCSSRRRSCVDIFASAIKIRIDLLEKSGRIPATRGNDRWTRQSLAIAEDLRMLCGEDTSGEDAPIITWEAFLDRIKCFSLLFPVLCYFGAELSKKRMNLRTCAYDNSTMKVLDRFELPIWVGQLPVAFRHADGKTEWTAFKVVVTVADSTWHPILLSEWGKLSSTYGLSRRGLSTSATALLRPRPRRATPLPTLARIKSFTGESLEQLSAYLRRTDEVIEIRVPQGNTILVMNRLQACKRLRSSSIWQYYLRQRRDVVDEETWSLAYSEEHPSMLTRVMNDPFSEDHGYNNARNDGDLFAFMEPTDEGNDEAGRAQIIDMARNIRELLNQFKTAQDIRIERLQQQIMGISRGSLSGP